MHIISGSWKYKGWPYGKVTYSNWAAGQPDNDNGDQDCGLIQYDSEKNVDWTWTDENCDDYIASFICERKMMEYRKKDTPSNNLLIYPSIAKYFVFCLFILIKISI